MRFGDDQSSMTHSEELAAFKESLGELVGEAPQLEPFVEFVESAEVTESSTTRPRS